MEGTPQIALLLLVLGLLSWAWPRPFGHDRLETLRRWVPVLGWSLAMLSRFFAAFNPSQWPHFAARLGAEANLIDRLAAVVSGDGLILVGLAVPLWWAALRQDEDAAWTRSEVVIPLALFAMLGLEGGVEMVASAPSSPTVDATPWDGFLFLLALVLGAAWMGWRPHVTAAIGGAGALLALVLFIPLVLDDPALQAQRGPSLLAAAVVLSVGPRTFPRASMAAPQGLAVWLSLSVLVTTVLLALLLPRVGGHEAWAVVGATLRMVTVVAIGSVVALLSLRVGLDAQAQATWTMGRRAWCVAPLFLIVVAPGVVLVAACMWGGSWVAWGLLRWWPTGSKIDV